MTYCTTHEAESATDTLCWINAYLAQEDIGACQMVEMELHPAGTRVVTADSEHCDECGQAYDDVYALPDDLWALIHERAPAGLLCPGCALRRVVASSRVVTAEALVIEPGEDDLWPEWAIDLIWEAIGPSFNRGQINHILDALAQSKDAP